MAVSETDRGLISIKMAAASARNTNRLLAKYGKITPKLPLTVPHVLAYGPAGTGKTTRIEQAAKIMGCSEGDGSFIRINADCVKSIEELIQILLPKLSWQGYLCNHGKTNHENCPKEGHKIADPINPKGPVKPQLVFLDEIHVLPAATQEKLGLVILDFRYQIKTKEGLQDIFFPRFTFSGATTIPGDLIRPLRTRFGLKLAVQQATDEEMVGIVNSMISMRGWKVDSEVVEIISKMAQGTPREADNHLTGLFNCWIYLLEAGQCTNKYAITKEVAKEYLKLQQFTEDGISLQQVRILEYLSSFVKGDKIGGAGVTKISCALNIDERRFLDELEPRLVYRGLITSGKKGREITEKGMEYLNKINTL